MVLSVLKTVLGILILSVAFSAPFIGLYLGYELVWPKVAAIVRSRLQSAS